MDNTNKVERIVAIFRANEGTPLEEVAYKILEDLRDNMTDRMICAGVHQVGSLTASGVPVWRDILDAELQQYEITRNAPKPLRGKTNLMFHLDDLVNDWPTKQHALAEEVQFRLEFPIKPDENGEIPALWPQVDKSVDELRMVENHVVQAMNVDLHALASRAKPVGADGTVTFSSDELIPVSPHTEIDKFTPVAIKMEVPKEE